MYIQVHTSMYQCILVCTGMYWYILVHTTNGCGTLAVACLGGLTAEETAMRKKTVRNDQAKSSAETRRRRRANGASSNEVCRFVEVCACTYQYTPVCTSMYLQLTKLELSWNSTLSHCIPCIGAVQPLSYFSGQKTTCLVESTYRYVLVHTGMYNRGILVLSYTVLYQYVLVRTSMYHFAWSCPGVQDSRCVLSLFSSYHSSFFKN